MTASPDNRKELLNPEDAGRARAGALPRDLWVPMGAIVLLAMIFRVPYLFEIREWPFFYHPILDSRTQYKWAAILLNTKGLGNPEVLAKAPLYAYFLAFNQWLFDREPQSLFSARVIQLVLGAVTCGLTYLLGRRAFGQAAGILAGLMLALYSPGIFRDGQLLDTALAMFLATTFLLVVFAALEAPSRGRWFGAGLLLGLLGLARPNLLLLGPVTAALLVGWFLRERQAKQVGRMVAALALGVLVPILPITARNYLISGGLVPISGTGGINLYTGNNPNSDGYSPIPSGIAWERTSYQAHAGTGKRSARAHDAYWRSEALRFWRQQPLSALGLLAKKVYLYWNAYEIPNNVSYDWGRANASVLRMAPLTFAVVGPLSLLGIALGAARTRPTWLLTSFVAANMLAVVSFFVCGRYRMPVLPVLCVFAGWALVELLRLARARMLGRLALGLAGLAVFAVFVNSDAYKVRRARGANRDWYYLGQSYVMGGDYVRAIAAFRQATEQNPHDADAYALLGQMELRTGEPQAAAEDMKRSLEIAPDFTTTAARLAELYLAQGWPLEEPERLLHRALEFQPRHVWGLALLTRVHVRQGRLQEAKADLERATEMFSTWNRADTRWGASANELMRAAEEARAAGVAIPEGL
ncbi:MAG: tetratricopeptide repeat protein [Armatimonadota bacterium]|nr:MAG: tetratricopeptide repeat protein [Armatimonadota bacterium]